MVAVGVRVAGTVLAAVLGAVNTRPTVLAAVLPAAVLVVITPAAVVPGASAPTADGGLGPGVPGELD